MILRGLKQTAILLAAAFILAAGLTLCPKAFAEGIDDWAAEEPSLRLWDEGELVARLQYELSACGYYRGEQSGLFDAATFRAVKALQKDLAVAVDGVYGPETHRAYIEAVQSGSITPDYPYMHELEGLVIGIDPGHQANADLELEVASPLNLKLKKARMTEGCAGVRTGVSEESINLSVAKMLEALLSSRGATVVMTRTESNVDLSNAERAALMNEAGVDCWIRIHCSHSSEPDVEGARVLIPAGIANVSISYSSSLLGSCIIEAFCDATGENKLAPHYMTDQAGFNWSTAPVIALEMGYLSNSVSDLKLCRASYQERCAEGIFNGLLLYFNGFDLNEGSNEQQSFAD